MYEYVVEEEEEREKVDVPEFLVRKFTPSRQLIASERVIDGLDVKEICLTNGARIILKRTKDEDRQITLTAFAKGGASVLTPENYPLLEGVRVTWKWEELRRWIMTRTVKCWHRKKWLFP